ncbi:glycogen/starch/alpha-glucan phosphorylase [Octadecabacter sp. G9-8]|uniref:Alpha-1,4 glucan phosphorylase n=1 Tax=Octadecabacter dasysiphoniae TaxID=2909341 RepID=A0ABS9CS09_9RHOB|nr:glycogen/starch/alpha-glucan phosphorylase [Octadecabacter dasysiphoniae]MCF2869527.1 glycogen/starch/alpha-glucan phosphorylase [Octadecabacter dasysiphoniae]
MTVHDKIALTADDLQGDISRHLKLSIGKDASHASLHDWRMALSLALRDRVVEPWFASTRKTYDGKHKRVYYLSMEFLIGRLIEDVTINLQVEDMAVEAMKALGQDYYEVVKEEPDAALGNGGLGRLAACFMDSLATLAIPAYGYGIRYEHGLFEQHFENGQQTETAEGWLAQSHVWEFERPEVAYKIHFGGYVSEENGKANWNPSETVLASAYDTPVVGWQAKWANTLRLWAAKPIKLFDLESFNRGDYVGANAPERLARTISRVLYPDDTTTEGKELRLKQEYFFTSASIKDLLRRHDYEGYDIRDLHDHVAIQLNDTHPAIAGPELIRLLVDKHDFSFDEAIDMARKCLGYTNHTLLPEALEKWPADLFARILPRHYRIIEIIQDRHIAATGSDIRIIEHGNVKMGELAFIMAHSVNGVSALHSDLVKETVFHDLNAAYPNRILNQTNGITPRRWLYSCNPALRGLITDTIGTGWESDLERLTDLNAHLDDASFQEAYRAAKSTNKDRLAAWLQERSDVTLDTSAMFDIQIKRIHEYKRQHLNILETIALWNDIRDNPNGNWTPRVKIFGGKAAPGYALAKSIIRLINDVAATINNDPITREFLQVVYPENYNVSMAEILIPASDLSEQISTAGKEASGTGNMKLSLNGSPTIGTLDGANVEIREHVGAENFFLFGLTAAEATEKRKDHGYSRRAIESSPKLSRVLGQIAGGVFSNGDHHRYSDILHNLYEHDYFLVSCDFDNYFAKQREVDAVYQDVTRWTRMAAANTAGMGWFSSDRTIRGYADDIWGAKSVE